MGKSSNNSSTIAKSMIAVVSIVIAIIFACVIGGKISNNKIAESTENYTVDSKTLGAEDTVQTGKVIVNLAPADIRKEVGIVDELIRLSVGIEDVDDLIEDLRQAIENSVKA